jgi:hypothetical protein
MRYRGRHGTFGLVFVVALTLVLTGCSNSAPEASTETPTTHAASTQIALFGDSLAWEAQPYYDELARAAGDVAHTYDSHGGTAICDWLTQMREVQAKYHPTAVQLEFSGNNLTPCMKGYELYSPEYYEKYRADTLSAIEIFTAGGAHVFLIGAPITRAQRSVPDWQRLNMQYEEIAAADPAHVTYVDAGVAIELRGHRYTDTLPCLEHEACTGPVVDGVRSNVVRSTDGVHFCPAEEGNVSGVIGGCSVYSSGAYRYAKAMFEPLAAKSSRD